MPKKKPRIATYFENTYQPELDAIQTVRSQPVNLQHEPALWKILQRMSQDPILGFTLSQTLQKTIPLYKNIVTLLLKNHDLGNVKIIFKKLLEFVKKDESATQLLLKTLKHSLCNDTNRNLCTCDFHQSSVTATLMTLLTPEQQTSILQLNITLPTPPATNIHIHNNPNKNNTLDQAVQTTPISTRSVTTQTRAASIVTVPAADTTPSPTPSSKRKRNFLLAGLTAIGTVAATICRLHPTPAQQDPTTTLDFIMQANQTQPIQFATSTAASTMAATLGAVTGTPRFRFF